jgi:hypothetical protein
MTIKINYPKSGATGPTAILNRLRARKSLTNANKITMPTGLTNGSLVTGLSAGQIFTLTGMASAGSGSTITVTGMDMATDKEPFMTKHEYIVIKTDLLAMSCARHRTMENTGLLNEELAGKVTPEDHEMASNIRRYYSDKCIVWKLKDKDLSEFRKDMYAFLNTDGTKFEEKMVSLAYRMPTFYEYDTAFDEIRKDRNVAFESEEIRDSQMHHNLKPSIHTLTPIKMLYRRTKTRNQNEYWFHDENNHLVVIEINPTNSLLPIWTNLYERESLKIYGYYWLKLRNDTPCFSPQRWEIMENRKESIT